MTRPTPTLIRATVAGHLVTAADSEPGLGDGPRTITGRVATYESTVNPSGPWGTVQLADGALSLPDPATRVKLLFGHDWDQVIGSLRGGLDVGADGAVTASFSLARTPAADDALSLAEDGHVDGLSVGYYVRDGELDENSGVFTVTAADLFEVSLVPFPADAEARVGTVTAQEGQAMPPETEPAPGAGTLTPAAPDLGELVREQIRAALAEQAPPAAAPVLSPAHATTSRMADAGEYLSAFVAARVRGDSTELARITAAVADQTTADVPGIIPVPILGPVISLRQGLRPLWASLTSRPMPQYGATFNRPKVTQNTVVGTQTAEKAELLSQALKIEADSVAKVTVGGTLDVSFQSIDWTEPALMNVLVSDFADSYAWYTEQWLSAQFELSANGNAGQTADPADPAAVIAAFYNAAADVYAACFRYPDTVWASVDSWAALGSLVDGDGRPLFPNVSPSNAAGGTMGITSPSGSPLGARLVVSPFLTDGTIVVGSSAMYETYEKVRGLLQATNVTQLGMDLSYSGYVAQYCIEQAAFQPVHLTTPAVQSTSTKSTSTTSGS